MDCKYKIDYSVHPKYRDVKVPLLKKFIANISFVWSSIISFLFLFKGKQFPAKFNNQELKNLPDKYQQFSNDGVLGIVDQSLSNNLKNILEQKLESHREGLKPNSERRLADCIKSITLKTDACCLKEIEGQLLKNIEFKEILDLYFMGGSPSLRVALIHINSENDEMVIRHSSDDEFDDELSLFHVDTNLNTLKCMVYLNDVMSIENGAFEYVKTSHLDYDFFTFLNRRVIRKIKAFERDLLSKTKLMSLLKIFRKKNEFTDFKKDSELGCFITKNKKTFMNPHNLVVFNPLGIHRGGRVFKGERLALQLVFCCDDLSWRII